jgi:hypothetical protein
VRVFGTGKRLPGFVLSSPKGDGLKLFPVLTVNVKIIKPAKFI